MAVKTPQKKTLFICGLIYLIHVFASHFMLPHLNKTDIYPFFNWDLFSFTEPEIDDFFIFVKELDGKLLPEPKLFIQNRDIFPGFNSVNLVNQIPRFGKSLLAYGPDDKRVQIYRVEMERNLFFTYNSAVYEIAIGKMNYRKYLKDGTYGPVRSLGEFKFQREEVAP